MNKIYNTHIVESGTTLILTLGSLELIVESFSTEWRIHWRYHQDPFEHADLKIQYNKIEIDHSYKTERFASNDKNNELTIAPLLSPLSIITRPEVPLIIPAEEHLHFFITHPCVITLNTKNAILKELSTRPMAESWFGPGPHEGEICHAIKTPAKTRLEDIDLPPYRVLTKIKVINGAKTPLPLEKIKIPVPLLSIYWDFNQNVFFTEDIILEREKIGNGINFSLSNTFERAVGSYQLAGQARTDLAAEFNTKTLSSFLSI